MNEPLGVSTELQANNIPTLLQQAIALDEEIGKLNKDYSKKFEGIRQLANMARNIQQAYIDAEPQLKRHYLNLFFDRFMVKEGKIIAAIPSKDIQPLIKEGKIKVRVMNNWLPAQVTTRMREWINRDIFNSYSSI